MTKDTKSDTPKAEKLADKDLDVTGGGSNTAGDDFSIDPNGNRERTQATDDMSMTLNFEEYKTK